MANLNPEGDPPPAEAAAEQGRWLGMLSQAVPQFTCVSDRAP